MKRVFTFLLLLGGIAGFSQSRLINSSFEGTPQDATVPVGWFACQEDTTPDILPGFWGVYTEASQGETFLGLIYRNDDTFESIGQRLSQPLEAEECYEFSVDLAHSKTYAGYNQPLKLRVWGGSVKCQRKQLLGQTDFINNDDWETYTLTFTAESDIQFIIIEAFYETRRTGYRGNILIDAIQPIVICDRA